MSYRQVLEEPRSHDVGGHFGENASLLVVPAVSVRLVLLARAGGSHGAVQAVPCRTENRFRYRPQLSTGTVYL